MLNRRFDQEQDEQSIPGAGATPAGVSLPAVAETLRSVSSAPAAAEKHPEKKDDEKISLFWRVFGGTILSIAALVLMTLYNNMASSITELRTEVGKLREERAALPKKEDLDAVRGDIGREKEARAAFIKKEDFDTRSRSLYDRIHVVEGYKADIEGVKERVQGNAVTVEAVKKDMTAAVDAVRKELAALDGLKPRLETVAAGLDALKKDTAGFEVLKERLAAAAMDLKTIRDDFGKLQQDVERNKAADLERKTSRDMQYKAVDDSLKELQKALLECREKLARLEGAQPAAPRGLPFFPADAPGGPLPKTAPKPVGGTKPAPEREGE